MGAGVPLRLGMVAGEASGDLLGSLLLAGLRRRWPDIAASGIGGPRLLSQGFRTDAAMERLSVFGYADALKRLPELLWLRRCLGNRLIAERPSLFIGVDAPDFNFGLERRLRQAGLRTVHFVCPSIWAWRGDRVNRIRAAADHVLCLFPFEPDLLARNGIAATYVGHPLADAIDHDPPASVARATLGLPMAGPVVALLPGSRHSEIEHLGPAMAAATALMARRHPSLSFVLPAAPGMRPRVEALWAAAAPGASVRVIDGQVHTAVAACDTALVCSGTATLEAALIGRPMTIAYRLSWLDWRRMKGMGYQPWVGLPNILAREFLVPELIQDAATPQAMADTTLAWLDDPARAATVRRRFAQQHAMLRQDTARKAADAVASLIEA